MAKVIITETDLTSHLEDMNLIPDIAYVPGFGDPRVDTQLAKLGVHLYQNPQFISTISQFKKLFGDQPMIISENYKFEDHASAWDPNSYDSETYLVRGTSPQDNSTATYPSDPGYIYALELLKAGMPIFYERLNPGPYDLDHNEKPFTVEVPGKGANDDDQTYEWVDLNGDSFLPGAVYPIKNTNAETNEVTSVSNFDCFTNTVEDVMATLNTRSEYANYSTDIFQAYVRQYCTADWVYHCFYNKDGITEGDDTTYTKFGNVKVKFNSTFLKLIDKGTFQIKYLTSGGWPTFDYLGENALFGEVDDKNKAISFDGKTKELVTSILDRISKDTSGLQRPVMEIMLRVCSQTKDWSSIDFRDQVGRGDCIALIDHTNYPNRPLNSDDPRSVFGTLNGKNLQNYSTINVGESIIPGIDSLSKHEIGSFGAMFTPWANYSLVSTIRNNKTHKLITNFDMPASFAYMKNMALYIDSYSKNHEAVAGPIRGRVKNAIPRINRILTNTIADSYQPVIDSVQGDDTIWNNLIGRSAMNAITNIHPYGQVIWGNRTLAPKSDEEGVKATHFLNIRNMVSDVRKASFNAARKYMFEQNSDILWVNFKSEITPTLEALKTNGGIKDFRIMKTKQENVKLWADIIIQPIYAVEEFKVNITIQDDDISVEDTLASIV